MPQSLFCLVGPTAVGKSAVALALASELDAEIVSADSMQVYRGMDIGTAKPSAEDRARVRHHLIDVVEPSESFDVARYRELALAAIADMRARGKTPLVVGGSGMYLRALTEGVFDGPSADPIFRERLENLDAATLHSRLAELDAAAAKNIGMHNKRRLIRALEVIEATGKKFSEQQTQWRTELSSKTQNPKPKETPSAKLQKTSKDLQLGDWKFSGNWGLGFGVFQFVGLQRERADLYRHIESRVDEMFAAGFIQEVRDLLKRGLAQNATAMQAAGYREVTAHLRGELSLADAKRLTTQRTRQLAKRQLTWFRHQATVSWLDVKPDENISTIVKKVVQAAA